MDVHGIYYMDGEVLWYSYWSLLGIDMCIVCYCVALLCTLLTRSFTLLMWFTQTSVTLNTPQSVSYTPRPYSPPWRVKEDDDQMSLWLSYRGHSPQVTQNLMWKWSAKRRNWYKNLIWPCRQPKYLVRQVMLVLPAPVVCQLLLQSWWLELTEIGPFL